eukprot:scaffold7234_cov335-Prasinococcus_capsulatus_cf.AAC.7
MPRRQPCLRARMTSEDAVGDCRTTGKSSSFSPTESTPAIGRACFQCCVGAKPQSKCKAREIAESLPALVQVRANGAY